MVPRVMTCLKEHRVGLGKGKLGCDRNRCDLSDNGRCVQDSANPRRKSDWGGGAISFAKMRSKERVFRTMGLGIHRLNETTVNK